MIESTVLATGGCFLILTVTVSVDLVADCVVDPADLVDLVVDLKYPVDLYTVLRSVEAFLLFTISVLCAVFCVECLDCNLCLGSTFDHCFCICVLSDASMLWICGQLPCRLLCRSITHCPCRFVICLQICHV